MKHRNLQHNDISTSSNRDKLLVDHSKMTMMIRNKKNRSICIGIVVAMLAVWMVQKGSGQSMVRFATFNISLNRNSAGALIDDLSVLNSTQPGSIAEIIQRVRPDVILLNEFDFDEAGEALQLFQANYLNVSQSEDTDPIMYAYSFSAPSNTGIPSGVDFDNDNTTDGPNDAFGFGFFPGQFAMAVLSKYPIDYDNVRTFQKFLWRDMPDALLPTTETGESFLSDEALAVFRLSSKSHWDIPVLVDGAVVHVLASHPTPPVFDGPEDRNGKRNFDEIRFWADYVADEDYIYDDDNITGGLPVSSHFVIMGDQNSDPNDGDSVQGAAQLLLEHPLVNTELTPASEGGSEQALVQAGNNVNHTGNPAFDTADFGFAGVGNPDASPGNLRVDYVLPSATLEMVDAGVYWPPSTDPELFALASFPTSDHRLVYADVTVPPGTSSASLVSLPCLALHALALFMMVVAVV